MSASLCLNLYVNLHTLARRTLAIDIDYDFTLLGIATPMKSYQAAWWINRSLGISLVRCEPLEILLPKSDNLAYFPRYQYRWPDTEGALLHLLGNAGTQGFLVPEFKTLDYFLHFDEESSVFVDQACIRALRQIKLFQAVVQVEVDHKLRSKEHLVF